MKPPVLKVKKDADQEVVFHYSRDERLSRVSAPRGPSSQPRGFLRGLFRRGRVPAFLPLLVVIIALILVARGGFRSPGRAVIAGWEAVLRASPYEDSLLVSVTFLPEPGTPLPAEPPVASVVFVLPDTGERLLLSEGLGQGPSTIRGRMRYTGKEKKLTAEVRLSGQTGRADRGREDARGREALRRTLRSRRTAGAGARPSGGPGGQGRKSAPVLLSVHRGELPRRRGPRRRFHRPQAAPALGTRGAALDAPRQAAGRPCRAPGRRGHVVRARGLTPRHRGPVSLRRSAWSWESRCCSRSSSRTRCSPRNARTRAERASVGYRTTLGLLGIAAAVLHFFLPERPILLRLTGLPSAATPSSPLPSRPARP